MSDDSTHKTTNHEEIKKWVEKRHGLPAVVTGTQKDGQGIGVLRIDFKENQPDEDLRDISWEEFFDTFDKKDLAFLYQDQMRNGQESRFCKFVSK